MNNSPFPPIAYDIERQIKDVRHLVKSHSWWLTGPQAALYIHTHEEQKLCLRFEEKRGVRLDVGPITLKGADGEEELRELLSDVFLDQDPWNSMSTQAIEGDDGEPEVLLTLYDALLQGTSLVEMLLESLQLHCDAVTILKQLDLLPHADHLPMPVVMDGAGSLEA